MGLRLRVVPYNISAMKSSKCILKATEEIKQQMQCSHWLISLRDRLCAMVAIFTTIVAFVSLRVLSADRPQFLVVYFIWTVSRDTADRSVFRCWLDGGFLFIPFGGRKSTLLISEKDAEGEILFRLLPLSLDLLLSVCNRSESMLCNFKAIHHPAVYPCSCHGLPIHIKVN